jgi:LPXTG-motif cell wall-anchored protein
LEVVCSDNALTSLKLGNNANLKWLVCHDNELTSLDLSKNTGLTYLSCENNKLTTLNLSNNTKLGASDNGGLNCSNNNLTSLDVSKCTSLPDDKFYCNDNTYKITAVNGVFDLKDLPGDFDLNNVVADSWEGATVKDGKLIIDSKTNKVTYSYYCGSDKSKEVEFTLLVTHTTKSDDAKSPATGDESELGLFAFAGLISAVGFAFMLRRKHSM